MKKESKLTTRRSGIEFLKIVAIFLITFSHCIPKYGSFVDLSMASRDVQNFYFTFIDYMGQLGNCIFIYCSSYFLLGSNKTRLDKILHLFSDTVLLSILGMAAYVLAGGEITFKEMVMNIMPVTFDIYWFVDCYILFYICHPLLNIILCHISQRTLLGINIFNILFFGVIKIFTGGYDSVWSLFIYFIVIYFAAAYIKKYMGDFSVSTKKNLFVFCVGFFGLIAFLLLLNCLGLHFPVFSNKMRGYKHCINIFIMMIAFSGFNLVNRIQFTSRMINYISKSSLLIYCISQHYFWCGYHENAQVVKCLEYIYGNVPSKYIALGITIFAVIVFIVSLLISIIYRACIQKWIYKCCDCLSKWLSKLYERGTELLLHVK